MTHITAAALRQLFLDFFKKHGHTVVKSSPLVPANDPSLMFTNAGMVQFKDVFVGAESRPYKRAVTVQKCMRVSGKHNDLEEVGRTARHHTFFEMLGNFSFGDYFKEEAIVMAWRFIQTLDLNEDKLWVTVFGGADGVPADLEARRLWRKISGLPDSRILDKGAKDNFWSMGDTGPCGPCTEIHVDQGEGTPTEADFDNGRVMEIWNNVFMQFDRQPGGKLLPLPAPSVDTGLGLERLTALVQHQDSNYHSDLFMPLLDAIAAAANKPYRRSPSEDDVSMRVIADHARATAFLVAEGVQPANEGRGYVMRRIMRRAIRHGRRLGFSDLFMPQICAVVVREMGQAYPELREAESLIGKVAQLEEEGFRRTLDTGLRILADEMIQAQAAKKTELHGDVVFKMYDTYGFPKDLTEVIAAEQQLSLDEAGFNSAMQAQKERSRGGDVGHAGVPAVYKQVSMRVAPITFIGYPHEDTPMQARPGTWRHSQTPQGEPLLQAQVAIQALIQQDAEVTQAAGLVDVVLQPTPFYGESGGQVGDRGMLMGDGVLAEVVDCQKPLEDFTVCKVKVLSGTLQAGATVWAGYNPDVRKRVRAHHSATHMLHGALRRILGEHVKQAGSYVDAEHLRFDYAHFTAPTVEELQALEEDVAGQVFRDVLISTEELDFDAAKAKGAIALFGEKYGDRVRVITMGESVEFCGGTHAHRTRDIDLLLITREEAVQSGVRRIEASVGEAARAVAKRLTARLAHVAQTLLGQEPPLPDDSEAATVLQSIHKAMQQYAAKVEPLRSLADAPHLFDPASVQLQAPSLPDPFGIRQARAVRNTWQGIVQLLNARAADAQAIVQRYGQEDAGHTLMALALLLQVNRDNDKALEQHMRGQRSEQAADLVEAVRDVRGVPLLTTRVDNLDSGALREIADALRSKLPSGVLCLASVGDGKVQLLITVSKDLTARLKAGALIKELAPLVGGRGGGKPEMAQAGGSNPAGIDAVFAKLTELL